MGFSKNFRLYFTSDFESPEVLVLGGEGQGWNDK